MRIAFCWAGLWLGTAGTLTAAKPTDLTLKPGLQEPGTVYLSEKQGTIAVAVKGRDWAADKLKSYALVTAGEGANRIVLTPAGAELAADGRPAAIGLEGLKPGLVRLLTLTWKDGQAQLWLDREPVGTAAAAFSKFIGPIQVPDPDKQGLPYEFAWGGVYRQALSPADVASLYRMLGFANDPNLVIPKAARAPRIDGKLSPGEWDGAACLTGLHDMAEMTVGATPSRVWVTYDDDHLYVGYFGDIPERVRQNLHTQALAGLVKQTITAFDANVDADDSFEVTVVPKYPIDFWHRMVVNNLNTHYDYRVSPKFEIVLAWDPKWTSAAEVSIGGWVVETQIGLDNFGVAKPTTGTVWGMNFRRIWRQLQNCTEEWATGKRIRGTDVTFWKDYWASGQSVGQVRFGGDQPLFIRMTEAAGFETAEPRLAFEIVNPTSTARPVEVHVASNTGDLTDRRRLEAPARGQVAYRFSGQARHPTTNELTLNVRDLTDGQPIYRTGFWFQQRQELDVYVRHYPSFEEVVLELDLSLLRAVPAKDLAADITFVDADTGKPGLTQAVRGFAHHYPQVKLSTKTLPVGRYRLLVRLTAGDKPMEVERPFEKREPPEWLGSQVGLTDRVPPPFTALSGTEDPTGTAVACWGRTYQFGRSMLPVQVVTQGQPILKGPMQLVLTDAAGQAVDLAPQAGIRFTERTPARIEWTAAAESEPAQVRLSAWCEFDGFMWWTLTLQPRGSGKLNGLVLRVPIDPAWATLVNNYDYSLRSTGAMPREGLEKGGDPIWLGNERGGLQWLAETTAHWPLAEPKRCVRVIPRPDHTLLEVHVIDRPTALTRALGVEFGLVATPIRPAGDWHVTRGTLTPWSWGYGNYQPHLTDWCNPLAWPAWAYGLSSRRDPSGCVTWHDSGPYTSYEACQAGDSTVGRQMLVDLDYWWHEWAAEASDRWKPGPKGLHTSPASRSWQDFFTFTYGKLYLRHRYTGLYYDVSMPTTSDNPYAGGGVEVDGRTVSRLTVLGARQIAKRLYTFLRLQEPVGSIRYHMSGQVNGALVGFCEMIVDGENFCSKHSLKEPHNFQLISLDTFRAQYMGTNFGPPSWWLPQNNRAFGHLIEDRVAQLAAKAGVKKPTPEQEAQFRREVQRTIYDDPDREARWIVGIVMLHNASLWAAYLPGEFQPLVDAFDRYELTTRTYDFHGYWAQHLVHASPENKDLAVSVFREKPGGRDRAMLVVFNNTEFTGDAVLTVDWKALGLAPGAVSVRNEAFGQAVRLDAERIVVPIGRRDVRLVGIQKK